jgi:hypothetical protein
MGEVSDLVALKELEKKFKRSATVKFFVGMFMFAIFTTAAVLVTVFKIYGAADILYIVAVQSLLYGLSYAGHFLLITVFGIILLEFIRKGVEPSTIERIGDLIGALLVAVVTIGLNYFIAIGLDQSVQNVITISTAPLTYLGKSGGTPQYVYDAFKRFIGWGATISLINIFIGNPEEILALLSGRRTLREHWFSFDKYAAIRKPLKLLFIIAFLPTLIDGYKEFFSEVIPQVMETIKKLTE